MVFTMVVMETPVAARREARTAVREKPVIPLSVARRGFGLSSSSGSCTPVLLDHSGDTIGETPTGIFRPIETAAGHCGLVLVYVPSPVLKAGTLARAPRRAARYNWNIFMVESVMESVKLFFLMVSVSA